jgi:hypothetical protein
MTREVRIEMFRLNIYATHADADQCKFVTMLSLSSGSVPVSYPYTLNIMSMIHLRYELVFHS